MIEDQEMNVTNKCKGFYENCVGILDHFIQYEETRRRGKTVGLGIVSIQYHTVIDLMLPVRSNAE